MHNGNSPERIPSAAVDEDTVRDGRDVALSQILGIIRGTKVTNKEDAVLVGMLDELVRVVHDSRAKETVGALD